MRHLQKLKCENCGNEPHGDDPICPVCHSTEWIWHCDRHGLHTSNSQGCEQCGILFAGSRYYREADLASALIKNWENACQSVGNKVLARWAEAGLGNDDLAKQFDFLAQQAESQPDAALTATLARLDPNAPLYWRGRILSQMDFLAKGEPQSFADPDLARSILATGFSEWISDNSAAKWTRDIVNRCRERATTLGLTDINLATPLQWWWLLADEESLRLAAEKIRKLYVSATDARLASLFSKAELTVIEALALGTAPQDRLLMVGQAWDELVRLLIPTLDDLANKARQRPCSRLELQAVEQEIAEVLEMLRKQREQFRPRQAFLAEPPELLKATQSVRLELLHAFKDHDQAQARIKQLKNLINRGHIKTALVQAASDGPVIDNFSDLNLEFIESARVQYRLRRRRLLMAVIILAAGFILTLIVKLFFK